MRGNGQQQRTAIERMLVQALEVRYDENLEIFRLDVAERTVCAQLSGILQRFFNQHPVHTEYNLHGVEPKQIA